MRDIYFDLMSATPPVMPKKLPGLIKLVTSKVPELVKAAAAQGCFSPLTVHMSGYFATYNDGKPYEFAHSSGAIGNSGIGKGFLDVLWDNIMRDIRTKDKVSMRRLEEWARICKTKGANQAKPERPQDCCIQYIEPNTTNAAYIQLLKDAESNGGVCLYTNVSEVDMLDMMCGCHKQLSALIRNMTDKDKTWGAHRYTVDGCSGSPLLRWRFNFSTVPFKAVQFFKHCIPQGDLWRLDISYILPPTQRKGSAPRQGVYDEAWFKQLDEYIVRLSTASGEINVTPCNRFCKKLCRELEEIADLTDSTTFDSLYKRSLWLTWIKGCILYISEGYRWSKVIEEFLHWSLYHDIWSKINLFAPELVSKEVVTRSDVRKYGPANLLDLLPNDFDKARLEELRVKLDKPADASCQLHNWLMRGYITYSPQTGLYTKTEDYLTKHAKE